ncbi:MAG: tyrosine-type recombinase/integrase [Bacteroidetes bacterium]|nr:tyrosine-type recombinase/integrase [Bacteroidota bacterium]MBL7104820.1 tyrosine-type recombinase/integrase [Bacteroidales bacterium]
MNFAICESEILIRKECPPDRTGRQIRVESGKGRKDRYTVLSKKALEILRKYFKKYRPVDYLFFGHDKKKAIRGGTVQKALKKNLKGAGIIKDAHFHTFRYTFATHLLEQNVNIKVIQVLLGHTSIRTTMIYTHLVNFDLSKMKSPFDNF